MLPKWRNFAKSGHYVDTVGSSSILAGTNINQQLVRIGGHMVSVLTFYSDNPSLTPLWNLQFSFYKTDGVERKWLKKRPVWIFFDMLFDTFFR